MKEIKVIKNNLILESCGQKEHKHGCYIRFSNEKIKLSSPTDDVIIDYDSNGEIVGIEFYNGLSKKLI